jgi:tetratricopeptide (TPR) repeat protein
MGGADTDRNLLFGVLALQLDLIDAAQFADACSGWAARKREASLAGVLAGRGWISAEDRAEVGRLLERKLRRHGGDAHASLAAVADGAVHGALAAVSDPEVQQSLAGLGGRRAGGHVLLSTIGYQPESRERYTLTRLHAQGGLGRVWEARESLTRAREIQEQLARDDPEGVAYQATLASTYRELGRIERTLGRPDEALGWFRKARALDEAQARQSVAACYNLACDWAVCIPLAGWGKEDSQLDEAERAERGRLGGRGDGDPPARRGRGWRSVDHLSKDEDLEALRGRPDFRALIRELGGGAGPEAAP